MEPLLAFLSVSAACRKKTSFHNNGNKNIYIGADPD